MRIILCALALTLTCPASAQGTAKPPAPPAVAAMKAGPPPSLGGSPQRKALVVQLNGLKRQKLETEAAIAQVNKQIATLEAKKAAGKASPSDLNALKTALERKATLEKALADTLKKISETEAALASTPN